MFEWLSQVAHTFGPSFVSFLGQAAVLVDEKSPNHHPQADHRPNANECDDLSCHIMVLMGG